MNTQRWRGTAIPRQIALVLLVIPAALLLLAACDRAGGPASEPAAGSAGPAPRPIERRLPTPRDPATEAVPAPSSTAALGALSTVDQLDLVVPHPRDLRDLTLRLDPTVDEIPLTVPAEPWQLDDQERFWVRNTATNRALEITATLVYSTPVAYVWVEEDLHFPRAAVEQSINRFTDITYPNVVTTFGSEWHPGVDNDPRLHILYTTQMSGGLVGYFSGADEYTRAASPFSNQKEMFYINLAALANPANTVFHDTTLAHEFQHMIHWHMDRGEDLWINEGLSEYAQEVAEFAGDTMFVTGFAANPDLQLTTWNPTGGNNGPHYGSAYLFIAYLAQRFGREAITELVAAPANGLEGVDAALRRTGAAIDAEQLFADWVVANYADQPDALGEKDRYGYAILDLPDFALAAQYDRYPVAPQKAQVANYATDYYELKGDGAITFTFAGAPATTLAALDLPTPASAADAGGPNTSPGSSAAGGGEVGGGEVGGGEVGGGEVGGGEVGGGEVGGGEVGGGAAGGGRVWWGNRADDAETRLMSRYDLTTLAPGAPLTLTATMWWDIETEYDYGYVLASRDGEHWQFLSGRHTTTENPSGNALGPGYTEVSGANPNRTPQWVVEEFDLTSFAGGPLWLAFSYVTDDAVTLPGWFIADVQLQGPTGPLSPLPPGWRSEGWLYTDNYLPQRWLLQLLEFDGDTLTGVRRIPVDAGGHATVAIDDLDRGRRAVVAVSALAPVTTEPAFYTYSIVAQ